MSKARRLIKLYQSVQRNIDQIERVTACHGIKERAGLEWDEAEKAQLNQAGQLFYQAQKKFDEVMAKKIGDRVTYEVRTGDWKDA